MPRPPTTTAGNARATPTQQAASALGRGALYCFEDYFIPIRDYGPCIIYAPIGTYLQCPAKTYVRGNYYGVEIDMNGGPQTLGVTGAGTWSDQLSREWLIVLCEDLTLSLYQVEGSKINLIPWDVAPPVFDASAQHVTLAFDQSSKPVIAWQQSDGLHVRQYDEFAGAYTYSGPYPGVDPVLLDDASVMYDISISDIILFYLSADRLRLNYRIQNENFGTEHLLYTFTQPVLIDSVDALFYRYQIRYALASGDPETSGGVIQAMRSVLYPYEGGDTMLNIIGPPKNGMYSLVVTPYTSPAEPTTATVGALLDGEYAMPFLSESLAEASTATVGALLDGLYKQVILSESLAEAGAGNVGSLTNGAYTRVIFTESLSEAAGGSIGSLGDGSYT